MKRVVQLGTKGNAGLGDFFKKMLDKIDKYLTNDE